MAITIALFNLKGGVGKTTTAVNLAKALHLLGKRVLVIDTDGQGNASKMMGFRHATDKVGKTLYEVMSGSANIKECVYCDQENEESFDFIPSRPNIYQCEQELVSRTGREYILVIYFILGLALLQVMVFTLWGEHSFIAIHDNLDLFVAHNKIMKNQGIFFGKAKEALLLGGVSRNLLGSEFSLYNILYVLFQSELCVCDLAEALQVTQSAISHQLRLLKQAKLVKNRREGKTVFYSLADDHVRTIINQGMEHIEE